MFIVFSHRGRTYDYTLVCHKHVCISKNFHQCLIFYIWAVTCNFHLDELSCIYKDYKYYILYAFIINIYSDNSIILRIHLVFRRLGISEIRYSGNSYSLHRSYILRTIRDSKKNDKRNRL